MEEAFSANFLISSVKSAFKLSTTRECCGTVCVALNLPSAIRAKTLALKDIGIGLRVCVSERLVGWCEELYDSAIRRIAAM